MIAVIDYGVGNLFSLERSLSAIGKDAVITRDKDAVRSSDRIILPGVGAFADAARKLRDTGMADLVTEEARRGKPLLGICLGMQLLFEKSSEYGVHPGLGLIGGEIVPLSELVPAGYKIPHIGWNALHMRKESALYSGVSEGECVYFVHSFCAVGCKDSLSAVTEYGAPVTASVERGCVFGTQFHPEKSGKTGLKILKNFCEVRV